MSSYFPDYPMLAQNPADMLTFHYDFTTFRTGSPCCRMDAHCMTGGRPRRRVASSWLSRTPPSKCLTASFCLSISTPACLS
jgi:hypothetical protein